MPVLFSYLLKLSVSLAVVFLFYHFVLRKLTFYNWNRWYLLGYTLLSFFIPFIDITGLLERNEWSTNNMITWVPVIYTQNSAGLLENNTAARFGIWDGVLLFFIIGMMLMLLRLFIQLLSFYGIKRKAVPLAERGLNIFHVNENIIPFSFGNSIFINRHLHNEQELEEIIRHEFIHVKQKHSLDIVCAELLCILNWYNPFAWLLKRSIRQNLEFIADDKVIGSGINKKEYQYLLLKVIGNTQFSIATQFNFSSLKKRIAMMNKTKSAKRQAARFLFLLPVLAVILLSFRKSFRNTSPTQTGVKSFIFKDTIPEVKGPNSKGYFIDIKDNKGNCTVVIKDKDKKEVTRLLLTEWNEKADYYEGLYGEIPPPPKPVIPAQPAQPVQKIQEVQLASPVQVAQPEQPAQPGQPSQPANAINCNVNAITADYDVVDNKAIVKLKDGRTEIYNLKDDKEKKQFIEKYGKPVLAENINSNNINNKINPVLVTTLKSNIVSNNNITAPTVVNSNLNTTVNSDHVINAKLATTVSSPVVANVKSSIAITAEPAVAVTVDADIVISITKSTGKEELDKWITSLKEKGYELKFTNRNYNDGVLTGLSGTIKYKDNSSTFSATDFNDLTIVVFREGDNVAFKILIDIKKKVV